MFDTEAGCSDKDSNAETDETSKNLSYVVPDDQSLTVYDSDEYYKDSKPGSNDGDEDDMPSLFNEDEDEDDDDEISDISKFITPVAVKKGRGRPKKNNGNN